METFYEKRKMIAGACAVILAATLLLSGGTAYYHAYWNVALSEPDWGDRVPYVMDNGNMVMQYQNVCIVEKLLDEHTSMCMAVQYVCQPEQLHS